MTLFSQIHYKLKKLATQSPLQFLNLLMHLPKQTHLLPFLLTLLTLLFFSCSAPKELEYRDYKNFELTKLGFSKSQVKMDLEYYNPNNFGLQLRRTDVDIFIENTFLGHSSSDTLIQIPRRGTFLLPIKFDADMQTLLKNAWITMVKDAVTIKVTGKVKVGKGNVYMSFPVNYEGKHSFSLF